MIITTNKKKVIASLILLVCLLLLISINYNKYIIDKHFNNLLFLISIIISILSSILFAIKIHTTQKGNIIIANISTLMSILFSYIIIELLNQNNLFHLYIKRLIFNFMIIIFLHLLIYALCNKLNTTIILTNSLIFILGTVNYTVTCFRGTPLVPWDILSIKTATYVASNYTFQINYYIIIAFILYILTISIGIKANYKFKKSNLILRTSCIMLVTLLSIIFYKTDIINYFDLENNLWKPKDEYANKVKTYLMINLKTTLFNQLKIY